MNDELLKAYIIHSRSYGETSIIFDVFTKELGLVSTILKGAKKRKDISQLHTSRELNIQINKSNLPLLLKYEIHKTIPIKSKHLILLMYFNELIYKLVPKNQPQRNLYNFYSNYLDYMSKTNDNFDVVVVGFELLLLKNLGYGITSLSSNEIIQSNDIFIYDVNSGFKKTNSKLSFDCVSGETIIKIQEFNINQITELKKIRSITKKIIQEIAGNKSIKSFDIIQ